jgi:hypothetical protein
MANLPVGNGVRSGSYQNSADLLRTLPDVFSLNSLSLRMGRPKNEVLVYLDRWKRKQWVRAAGKRSGYYYNIFRNPDAGHRQIDVVHSLYPSAVLIAESVLHLTGWTTQIPAKPVVAILSRGSVVPVDGVEIQTRPQSWYVKLSPLFVKPSAERGGGEALTAYGIPALPPAYALADMWRSSGNWHPDPDDLDLDTHQWVHVAQAFQAIGVPFPKIYETAAAEYE